MCLALNSSIAQFDDDGATGLPGDEDFARRHPLPSHNGFVRGMLGWILPAPPKGFAARARFLLLEIATICLNEFSAIFFLSLTYNVLVNTPYSMPPRKTQLPAVPVQEPGTPSKTGTPIRRPSGGQSSRTDMVLPL